MGTIKEIINLEASDEIICKLGIETFTGNFVAGKKYYIDSANTFNIIVVKKNKIYSFSPSEFRVHFLTPKDIRKLKLEKIK